MAKLASGLNFIGSLGDFSAYKMRGVEGIIVRKKGGPTKKQIKTSPKFKNTRLNNVEFSGRARATKWIMGAIWPVKSLADYNIAGPLNALMKPIQVLDLTNGKGKRAILLSKNPNILQSFSLNRQTVFDSIVRTYIPHTLSRQTLTARIEIPQLIPSINFHPNNRHPMYRIVAGLGVIPDLMYTDGVGYNPSTTGYNMETEKAVSDWYPALKGSPATILELDLKTQLPDKEFSLILSVGICFGVISDTALVEQVKYTGSAKVLAMA